MSLRGSDGKGKRANRARNRGADVRGRIQEDHDSGVKRNLSLGVKDCGTGYHGHYPATAFVPSPGANDFKRWSEPPHGPVIQRGSTRIAVAGLQ